MFFIERFAANRYIERSDFLRRSPFFNPHSIGADPMMARIAFPTLALAAFSTSLAHAQNTTVQLPTFNFTTAATTVTAPDGGTAFLGGIKRLSEGSNERGVPMLGKVPYVNRLFKNRGIGREVSYPHMTVTPRIIILEEEEFRQTGVSPETLSSFQRSPDPRFGPEIQLARPDNPVARKADFIARNITRHQRSFDAAPVADVAQNRRPRQDSAQQKEQEAVEFFAKAKRAESEGKSGVAKIYYQMAARRAQGEMQAEALTRLAALQAATQQGLQVAGN